MKVNRMNSPNASTRRSFLKKGALLAVPFAAAAPAAIVADDSLKSRLARLEDEAAIRQLHQSWLREFNAEAVDGTIPLVTGSKDSASGQSVRHIIPDHSGEPDVIEVSSDGKAASGHFQCLVEIETAIAQDSTLARMAHVQGSGFVRRTERRRLHVDYAKSSAGAWSIARAALLSA